MKRIVAGLLSGLMLFSLVACGQKSGDVSASQGADASSSSADSSQGGAISVDQNLFDVEITIPASLIEEGMTQEALDEEASASGYKSAVLNDDGSVTYTMTHQAHDKMMEELRKSIEQSMAEMIDPETYPSFEEISANDDYTEFTVKVSSNELGLAESMSALGFYMLGGLYNAFNGTPADDIAVFYVNADTGDIINEAHSSDAG